MTTLADRRRERDHKQIANCENSSAHQSADWELRRSVQDDIEQTLADMEAFWRAGPTGIEQDGDRLRRAAEDLTDYILGPKPRQETP